MHITVRQFKESDADAWDVFCEKSYQATFLHTRLFLSYHGDRFDDRSLIIEADGKWIGLFPAALSQQEDRCVISHPGSTYGGILHQGRLQGERMIVALELIIEHYVRQGYQKLLYKATPSFYHQVPAQDDVYALFRLDARLVRCDISSTIALDNRGAISQRRRRSFKKAQKSGVSIVSGEQYLADLWGVLENNLANKHGVKPVHSLEEIILLAGRFPLNIRCVCGMLGDEVIAGAVIFLTPYVSHAQYIASSDVGYDVSALDAVFEYCIETATQEGKRWFDFGISTENSGRALNVSLYEFKSEFGGGGTLHEFFELGLER